MKRSVLLGITIFLGAVAAQAATLTFTTCGATGAVGPVQVDCNAAYGGTPAVSVSGGIQTWTVPATGTYRITATGAQGASAAAGRFGGRGARVVGEFNLTSGQTLKLVVGQQGTGQDSDSNGGGGGGSFVVSSANVPLLIAGGGGGTRTEAARDGCDASVTEFGTTASGGEDTGTCAPRAGGAGTGGIVSDGSYGSAGAGFGSDGEGDYTGGGGRSWANGMLGGDTSDECGFDAVGGFGGGGAGNGCYGGGGAGGYSGGDGGFIAGGGGSYNAGTNKSATAGVGTGAGTIVIQDVVLANTAVPTLSEWGMILLSGLLLLAAVATLRRRRA